MAPLFGRLLLLLAAALRGAALLRLEPPNASNAAPLELSNASDAAPLPVVAVFVQAGYIHLWPDMQLCIESVAGSPRVGAVDVFVSTVVPAPALLAAMEGLRAHWPKVRRAEHMLAENRGADIGQFLQQVQALPPPRGLEYDFFVKVHTKGTGSWRHAGIDCLCGNASQVDSVLDSFSANPHLGLLGPKGLTFIPNTTRQHSTFNSPEVAAMQSVWAVMNETSPFPNRSAFAVSAGSFFWGRGAAFFGDGLLLAAVTPLLERMGPGYRPGSCCQVPHAVERLIATRMRLHGYDVAAIGGPMSLRRRFDELYDTPDGDYNPSVDPPPQELRSGKRTNQQRQVPKPQPQTKKPAKAAEESKHARRRRRRRPRRARG